jgi:DNA-binding GntR family transcriptional regulator
MTKQPVRRESRNAWEQAYEQIQELILGLAIKPGETVTETALSHRLGISRTPVREALKKLEQEGLIVTTNRRKRIYILTVSEMEEIFDLKICVEGAVARWAAERASDADRAKLAATVERMTEIAGQRPDDPSREQAWLNRWLRSDGRFHEILFAMAGNKRAQQVIRNCNVQWHRLKLGMLALEGRIEKSVREHQAVGRAILDRKPAAAQKAMENHLRNLKRELIKIMRLFHYPSD